MVNKSYTRKFGGKIYQGEDEFSTKRKAVKSATIMRNKGYSARILKEARETNRASTKRKPYNIVGKRAKYILYLRKR